MDKGWSTVSNQVPTTPALPSSLGRESDYPGPCSALIPPCLTSSLTKFGHVVDERVSLTVAIQVSQLGAAVEGQVVDAEPTLPCTAGVK